MTVVSYSGNAGDNAIGLIACSRHQSGSYMPWAQHRPKMDFINPVLGRPALDWMRKVTSPVQGKLMGQIMGGELLSA